MWEASGAVQESKGARWEMDLLQPTDWQAQWIARTTDTRSQPAPREERLEQGATTLWEQWNGTESRNHIMFGDISAWFYKALAGIQPDPEAPGFKHFFVRPQVVGDLTSARGVYDSLRGRIVSEWTLKQDKFTLRVVVPPNTRATVFLPGAPAGAGLKLDSGEHQFST